MKPCKKLTRIFRKLTNFCLPWCEGFPCGSAGKEFSCNVGDLGLITGLGRPPGEWKGYPLQYSGLENSMDTVHGGTKSQTGLSDFQFHFIKMVKEMGICILMSLQHSPLP